MFEILMNNCGKGSHFFNKYGNLKNKFILIEDLIHARDIIPEGKIISNADGHIVFGKPKAKI
jgi:hypothetical protein